jgi:hypothetical protein
MSKKTSPHKGLFLCILGLFLAFTANYFGHLSDLSFAIVGIITAYISGQSVDRGSAFFAASRDPNCDTRDVIHNMFNSSEQVTTPKSLSDLATEIEQVFSDISDYVEGSEKAIDEDDNEEEDE